MKRKQIYSFILLIVMLLITSFTLAWNAFIESRHVGKFISHELIYEISVDNNTYQDVALNLSDIVYVDYLEDFKDNFNGSNMTTSSLTEITKAVKFIITNNENSIDIKNILTITEPLNQVGLYYFIIVEDVYSDISSITWKSNYSDIIKGSNGILKDANTRTQGISTMNNYNNQQINNLKSLVVSPSEILAFQIIFYADHDLVVGSNPNYNYLAHVFSFNININTIQKEGVS